MKYHPDKNPDEGDRVMPLPNLVLNSIDIKNNNSLKRFLMLMRFSRIQKLVLHMINLEKKDQEEQVAGLVCLLMNCLPTCLEEAEVTLVLEVETFMEALLLNAHEKEKV